MKAWGITLACSMCVPEKDTMHLEDMKVHKWKGQGIDLTPSSPNLTTFSMVIHHLLWYTSQLAMYHGMIWRQMDDAWDMMGMEDDNSHTIIKGNGLSNEYCYLMGDFLYLFIPNSSVPPYWRSYS